MGPIGPAFFGGSKDGEKEGGDAAGKGTQGPAYDPIADVWKHYVRVMEPRHTGLDAQTRSVIRDALKVATVSECKQAIDGCRSSTFHMGDNPQRRRYNAVTQILKGKRGGRTTRENIDFFLDLAQKAGLQSGVPSAGNEKVRRAKRAVLDAAEFPGDEHVVGRGRQAEAWLVEQGWRIERQDGQPPRFVEPGAEA